MVTLAAAMLAAFGSSALPTDCGNQSMPPASYLNDKREFAAEPQPSVWDEDAYALRHGAPPPRTLGWAFYLGWTFREAGVWRVSYVAEDRCAFVHEFAHLPPNRWPGDHPGAVYWKGLSL